MTRNEQTETTHRDTGAAQGTLSPPARPTVSPTAASIDDAVRALGPGPLEQDRLIEHVWPLFSRVSARAETYLANHSLGQPLDRMAWDVQHALDMWYDDMDGVWTDRGGRGGWLEAITRFRALVADLIGWPSAHAVVPKLSSGAALRAVLNSETDTVHVPNVVTTRHEFDSTDFILKTYRAKSRARLRFAAPSRASQGVPVYAADDIIKEIDFSTDLVCVCHTIFNTGQIMPGLYDIIEAAHDHGAKVLVDAYHAAGVDDLRLFDPSAPNPDFVTGGSYKYARGGTGACFLAINPELLNERTGPPTLDTGWFAKKDTFQYHRTEEPEFSKGGDAWLESTPSVLPMFQAMSGLEFTLAVGPGRLRGYNLRQQALLREAMREHGLTPIEPNDPAEFGPFTLLPTHDTAAMCEALRALGVNTDARAGYVRFGPDILNTDDELRYAAEAAASAAATLAERLQDP